MKKLIRKLALIGVSFVTCQSLHAQLYAEVYTSEGPFRIELRFIEARRTVSHFMRLASGQQPWLDHSTGRVMTNVPFYNGTRFHKLIDQPTQIQIRAGSRDGTDTYSLGYSIRDEIRYSRSNPLLTHGAFAVSMVNRTDYGQTIPHSASSQFLITRLQDTTLNGNNSMFGIVDTVFIHYSPTGQPLSSSNGRAVVESIITKMRNGNQVTISSINFRRIGVAANSFDETQSWGELPFVNSLPIVSIEHTATDVTLGLRSFAGTAHHLYTSTDLFTWNHAPASTIYQTLATPMAPSFNLLHGGAPRAFFKTCAVTYPSPQAPYNLLGKTIFVGKQTAEAIRFIFDPNNINPTYHRISDNATGSLNYTYTPLGPFSGQLDVENTPGLPLTRYLLYFGGTELNPADTEQMRAIILRPMENSILSHFELTTP